MSNTYRQNASELTEVLLDGHLGVSADAKLVAEAILLGFAFHAEKVGADVSKGMTGDSIGAVLENVLVALKNERST